jgi:pyruvate dehydrogenase E2 component (dihydrolipoamide acetyltransferase)
MEEGTVLKWHVKAGDTVKAGDVLFELETDKATMEIESEHAGTVRRIVVDEGQSVAVHTPLAFLAESDADVDAWLASSSGEVGAQPASAAPQPEKKAATAAHVTLATAAAPSLAEGERIKVSPAARRMAAERGIDLSSVTIGSGPNGRITTADLAGLAAVATRPVAATSPTLAPSNGQIMRSKMTPMRKAISRNLTQSVTTAPHFYLKGTIESVKLFEAYRRQKKVCKASLNDLLVLAIARAMMQYPMFRSRVEGEEVVEFPGSNIGIAVGTDDGLRVPVVLDVNRMSLAQLAEESRRVVTLAREGKAVNVGKGSFTISNLGMFDVEEFTAIINPPEAAILAISAPRETVKVENGAIRATQMMTMWLSSDHRLIDGLMAARFMNTLKGTLESPETLEA